ncbi:MAG: PAC2 family protein, partial [Nanoarchaeota archaeon]
KIEIFYKKSDGKKPDLLILSGDVQPMDEVASYEFSEAMLDVAEKFKCKELITLGGIGLQDIPQNPKLYCTANNKDIIKRYRDPLVEEKLFGVVGPIVGVSGLLLGLATKRKIDAIAFLAETYGHPMYLGVKGARETLKLLNKKLGLKLNLSKLEKEMKDIESEIMKRSKPLTEVSKQSAIRKLKSKIGEEVDYIG